MLSNNVTSSKASPWFAGIAIVVSLFSLGVAFYKKGEKLSPELLQMRLQMQKQDSTLKHIDTSLRRINFAMPGR